MSDTWYMPTAPVGDFIEEGRLVYYDDLEVEINGRDEEETKMKKYIVFDLEATCWDDGRKRPNETIEIGAIALDEKLKEISQFHHYIRPRIYPILSEFCKRLTGMKQTDVDIAPNFPAVIQEFKNWVGVDGSFYSRVPVEYWLCSWGFYDRRQLIRDHGIHELNDNWLDRHISIKHQYSLLTKTPIKECGIKQIIEKKFEGKWDGRQHHAFDDAKNIKKVFVSVFKDLKFTMQGV